MRLTLELLGHTLTFALDHPDMDGVASYGSASADLTPAPTVEVVYEPEERGRPGIGFTPTMEA